MVVFGGAGRMGRLAVQDLAASAQAGEIIIADKSKEKAETLVRELKDSGTKVTAINGGRFSPDTAITTEILCAAQAQNLIRIGSFR